MHPDTAIPGPMVLVGGYVLLSWWMGLSALGLGPFLQVVDWVLGWVLRTDRWYFRWTARWFVLLLAAAGLAPPERTVLFPLVVAGFVDMTRWANFIRIAALYSYTQRRMTVSVPRLLRRLGQVSGTVYTATVVYVFWRLRLLWDEWDARQHDMRLVKLEELVIVAVLLGLLSVVIRSVRSHLL